MREDVVRVAVLRSQALEQILTRDVNALLNLKPTRLLEREEMTSLIEQAKEERAGLDIRTINENWKTWAQAYSKVLQKFQILQERYGEQEIEELFEAACEEAKAEGKSPAGEPGSGSTSTSQGTF
ncbi:hypothetical protein [Ammonifex thiophilus]|uniref:Uncharacterized protein n=1 Tax=Ammonifex thiophilus TaxID=444093 RepID=A0A3D8P1V8_9THEO|nr:hypothetical protein [Ammonifex thiophilus]RDV81837.1 hypothetical protein DXX99_08665 [Ammonifex thiophilus]